MTQDTQTLVGSERAEVFSDERPDIVTGTYWSPTREPGWYEPEQNEYRCEIRLCSEPEGGYSVYVPELPGVVSEGDTTEEAVRNMAEALRGVLRTYRQDDQAIPWQKDAKPLREGESRYWIVVNV